MKRKDKTDNTTSTITRALDLYDTVIVIGNDDVRETDVLFGRIYGNGGIGRDHRGTQQYRTLITLYQYEYCIATSRQRNEIVQLIISILRRDICNCRFLAQVRGCTNLQKQQQQQQQHSQHLKQSTTMTNKKRNDTIQLLWYEISDNDASKKIAHALQIGTTKRRQEIYDINKTTTTTTATTTTTTTTTTTMKQSNNSNTTVLVPISVPVQGPVLVELKRCIQPESIATRTVTTKTQTTKPEKAEDDYIGCTTIDINDNDNDSVTAWDNFIKDIDNEHNEVFETLSDDMFLECSSINTFGIDEEKDLLYDYDNNDYDNDDYTSIFNSFDTTKTPPYTVTGTDFDFNFNVSTTHLNDNFKLSDTTSYYYYTTNNNSIIKSDTAVRSNNDIATSTENAHTILPILNTNIIHTVY